MTSQNQTVKMYTCGRCTMGYDDYKNLVAHLYWKHGTESQFCNKCGLKMWRYAAHKCNILPIDDMEEENIESPAISAAPKESPPAGYCVCGRDIEDVPMIGCDGPQCPAQWYHFDCVGIVDPPDGDWFCSNCVQK